MNNNNSKSPLQELYSMFVRAKSPKMDNSHQFDIAMGHRLLLKHMQLENAKKKLETIVNTNEGDIPLKDYFKECLKELLVRDPPKRFQGDSGWIFQLRNGLAKVKLIEGGVEPCCTSGYCENQKPCSFNHGGTDEQFKDGLLALIDLL